MKTKIEFDRDKVRPLFERLNTKLFLLLSEKKARRQKIIDSLLEDKESPIKELAKIFGIDI